jgi:hypothetical protein
VAFVVGEEWAWLIAVILVVGGFAIGNAWRYHLRSMARADAFARGREFPSREPGIVTCPRCGHEVAERTITPDADGCPRCGARLRRWWA